MTGIGELAAREEPIVLAELGGGPPVGRGGVVCGPEGGWTAEELSVASGLVGLGEGGAPRRDRGRGCRRTRLRSA